MRSTLVRSLLIRAFLIPAVLVLLGSVAARAEPAVRVAALKFGTVNWVLETIKQRKLDKKHKVQLVVIPLASTNGAKIALQGGSADIVVTDWTFVSRRRAAGADFTMVPYSSAVGHLMVAADSPIKTIEDLRGKTIGVVGGPLDKSWLFFRAYTLKKYGFDIAEYITPVYGAPPLLTQKMMRGEFDGVLNFWHFSARLRAQGFRSLISVGDMMNGLGTAGPTVAIGFAFRESWAKRQERALKGFLAAVKEAVRLLDQSDDIWDDIRPLMNAKDEASFLALKATFREGILRRPLVVEQADVTQLFQILLEFGGASLVGSQTKLTPGTFWLLGDISQPVALEKVN